MSKKCAHCGKETDGSYGAVGPRCAMIPLCKSCYDIFCQTQDGICGSITFSDCDYMAGSVEVQIPDGSWKRVPLIPKKLSGTLDELRITKGKGMET
jgi:hypothetical protein